ncbi:fibronectin type III domain-containing protein [Cohnella hashimotonis]|uniref:Fibronectin type III domain-containing protein n=1 Tax=Cohnella hashimotonis TaxID=2826895 RepID=A0ABT6THT2_9BACL|nr:fibronectin type III domain-containing protein [Cohnella hashimotonis]MDI4645863.1 fibronectin type III domain-containing protein [Cohnella hashimotonis]
MNRRMMHLVCGFLILTLFLSFRAAVAEAATEAYITENGDEPPIVTRLEPASNHAVIRNNSMHVIAEAEDDHAQPSFFVQIGEDLRYPSIVESDQGAGRFDRVFDVTPYDGKTLNIHYSISDGSTPSGEDNRRVNVYRTVHIESSPELTELERQPDAQILDADASRLLLIRNGTLIVKNRTDGTETVLLNHVTTDRSEGFKLTPAGAVFLIDTGWFEMKLFWWNGETLLSIPVESGSIWQARGNYAAVSDAGTLRWIDTELGTTRNVTYPVDRNFELEPNGKLLLEPDSNSGQSDSILRYDPLTDSTTTAFTYAGAPRGPVTDGEDILFTLEDGSLMKYANGLVTEVVHGTNTERLKPHQGYEVNDGWIAYQKPNANHVQQLYLRSSEGTVTQATDLDAGAIIHALDHTGTLILENGSEWYRYSQQLGSPVQIAGKAGVVRWIDGQLHYLLGDTIFTVKSQPPTDTTAPTWPQGDVLTFSHVTSTRLQLNWLPATDESGVDKYLLYQNNTLLTTLNGTVNSYVVQGLSPKASYLFSLVAVDAAGNQSVKKSESIIAVKYTPMPKPEILIYHFDGTISDFDQSFILWKQSDDTGLWLFNRSDKSQFKVYDAAGSDGTITKATLTAEGVVYTVKLNGAFMTYEWKNGAVVNQWAGEGEALYQTRGIKDGTVAIKVDGIHYLYSIQEGKILYSTSVPGKLAYRVHSFSGPGEQQYRLDAWYRVDGGSLYGIRI